MPDGGTYYLHLLSLFIIIMYLKVMPMVVKAHSQRQRGVILEGNQLVTVQISPQDSSVLTLTSYLCETVKLDF